MFNVNLYTFDKHDNSTKRPSGDGTVLQCNIKSPSSLISPIAEFSFSSNPVSYNYAYISEFGRYYFITDWTFDRGLWIATLVCDVLATYKTEIGNSTLYVLRSASRFNTYAVDNMYPLTGKYIDYIDNQGAVTGGLANGRYVIAVAGSTTGTTNLFQFTPAQFAIFINNLLLIADGFQWDDVPNSLKNTLFDPMKYILSCMWFPNAFDATTTSANVKVGLWDSGVTAQRITNPVDILENKTFTLRKHPQQSRGKYLDLRPYSHYQLYIPPFGIINLDSSVLMDCTEVTAHVYVDAMTGEGELKVYNNYNTGLLASVKARYGVPVPLTRDTFSIANASSSAGALMSLENALGVTSSTAGVIATAIAGAGLGSAVGAITGATSNIGSLGGIEALIQQRVLHMRFYYVVNEDNTNNGRPLCEYVKLNTLTGFMIVQKGEVEINGTKDEQDEIRRHLERGFYYE